MTELLELRGVVEAPPDEVAEVLLRRRPGGRSPLAATGRRRSARGDEFAVGLDGSRDDRGDGSEQRKATHVIHANPCVQRLLGRRHSAAKQFYGEKLGLHSPSSTAC